MLVLQAGVAKSGNFWLWRILQNILIHSGIEIASSAKRHPSYQEVEKLGDLSHSYQKNIDVLDIEKDGCYFRVSSVYREKIADLDKYLNSTTHIWTHSPVANYTSIFIKNIDKVIYVIRDPRDVAISQARFAFTPYMQKYYPHYERDFESFLRHRFELILRNWVLHVEGWLRLSTTNNVYIIFYERLKENFDEEIQYLLNYLELPLNEKVIHEIKHDVSFNNMRKKDPNHVRKGESKGWQGALDDNLESLVDTYAEDMLSLLGYPNSSSPKLNNAADEIILPRLMDDVSIIDLADASKIARWKKTDYVTNALRVLIDDRPLMAKYMIFKKQCGRLKLL